jgi:hypothetical protein
VGWGENVSEVRNVKLTKYLLRIEETGSVRTQPREY